MVLLNFKESKIILILIFMSLGGIFHFGYQLTAVNPTEMLLEDFVNSSYLQHYGIQLTESECGTMFGFILVTLTLGNFIGNLLLVHFAERLGRKRSMYPTLCIMIVGLIFESCSKPAHSFEMFILGRFVMGVGCGLIGGLQPLYANECSPKESRGAASAVITVLVEAGYVGGLLSGLTAVLGTSDRWPYMYVLQIAPIMLLCIALRFLPESPKFLLAKGRVGEAKNALHFFRHENINASLLEIDEELVTQIKLVSISELFRRSHFRKALLLAFANMLAITNGGIFAVDFFSTRLFSQVGFHAQSTAQYGSVLCASLTMLSALISSSLVDRIGRRPLILFSLTLLILANIGYVIFMSLYSAYNYQSDWYGYMTAICILGIATAFGIGPPVMYFLIPAELVPQNARSPAIRAAFVFENFLAVLNQLIFLPMYRSLGAYSFLILHVIPLIICLVIFIVYLPETKNRKIVDIMRDLGYAGIKEEDESLLQETYALIEKEIKEK